MSLKLVHQDKKGRASTLYHAAVFEQTRQLRSDTDNKLYKLHLDFPTSLTTVNISDTGPASIPT